MFLSDKIRAIGEIDSYIEALRISKQVKENNLPKGYDKTIELFELSVKIKKHVFIQNKLLEKFEQEWLTMMTE